MSDHEPIVNEQKPYTAALAELRQALPEVEADYELIERMMQTLVESYAVGPELFDDKAKTLFFAALAQRLGKVRYGGEATEGSYRLAEEAFIADAAMLVAGPASKKYDSVKADIAVGDTTLPETQVMLAYDKYTNWQMTEEMRRAATDLLAATRRVMGITPETESPFEIRVLSVGDEINTHLMHPLVETEEGLDDYRQYLRYKEELDQRRRQFQDAVAMENISPAWLLKTDNKVIICLPQPMVEKLIYTDEPRHKYFSELDYFSDLSYFLHEYVHTQRPLGLAGDHLLGMTFEEVRAEMLSGDMHGYKDAKAFVNDMANVTGVDIRGMMGQERRQADFYIKLANAIGLQHALEAVLLLPKPYSTEAGSLHKRVQSHIGGYDALTSKFIKMMEDNGRGAEVERRIDEIASDFSQDPDTLRQWAALRKNAYGVSIIADLVLKRASAHYGVDVEI